MELGGYTRVSPEALQELFHLGKQAKLLLIKHNRGETAAVLFLTLE